MTKPKQPRTGKTIWQKLRTRKQKESGLIPSLNPSPLVLRGQLFKILAIVVQHKNNLNSAMNAVQSKLLNDCSRVQYVVNKCMFY